MTRREEIRRRLAQLREERKAAPGVRVHTFLEAEAVSATLKERPGPGFLMVSLERRDLKAFVQALRHLEGELYLQLVGGKAEALAKAAGELEADAVYLVAGEASETQKLCDLIGGEDIFVEAVLPWREAGPGQGSEGRIVDLEAAEPILRLQGLDLAAVPVGGGPGPYKSWRIPLWSPELFTHVVEARAPGLCSLPWGSLLPKELLNRFNRFGGALPGVVSLPSHQYRPFLTLGAVKIALRTDCALALLGGLRESFFLHPERSGVDFHMQNAFEALRRFLLERFAELGL